jgi:hypothetical protein
LTERFCPLTLPGPEGRGPTLCEQGNCAWWVTQEWTDSRGRKHIVECCAVTLLAAALFRIEHAGLAVLRQ